MPNPVTVLMILTVRYGKNGITNCVMNYVSRFDKARIRCDLVCPNEPGERARELIGQTGGEVFVLGGRNRRPTEYLKNLSRIIRERGEEIVHAHGNSATLYLEMLAAKRGGAKNRLPHSHNTTCKMKMADRLLRGAFYGSYTHAMACSATAGEWLYPKRDYDVLNNAIDAEAFRYSVSAREETRERMGLLPEETVFLHIGAFNQQKNQAFLLEAFQFFLRREPNARLLLVGDGEQRASCESRAEARGIRRQVEFLGQRDDIPALLSAADAFVLPSLHEGLPLTLIEARGMGRRQAQHQRKRSRVQAAWDAGLEHAHIAPPLWVSLRETFADGLRMTFVTCLGVCDAGVRAHQPCYLCADWQCRGVRRGDGKPCDAGASGGL